MQSSLINGNNFSLDDKGIINFFGCKGTALDDGTWGVNALGGDVWVQVASTSVLPEILQCIEQDVAAGYGDKIAQLHLGPRQAVVFFLEGKLTSEHLEHAIEPDGSNCIEIPNVAVEERTLTVRVINTADVTVDTADSDGNVIKKQHGACWSLDAGTINFFGAKGRRWNEKSWAINAFGGDLWCQVRTDSMMSEIEGCIAQDIAAGKGDQIAQVQFGPRQAVVFFLEGRLTVEKLKGAVEPESQEFIDIPGVTIGDRVLTVRVVGNPKLTVATADKDGNVI